MSLNPFTRKREKKEEEMKVKIEELQQAQLERQLQQQQQYQQPSFALPEATSEDDSEDKYAKEEFDKYLPASAKVDQQAPSYSYSGGGGYGYEPPSRVRQCFSKLQSGFMIGGALGGAFGTIYGTYAAVVYRHILYLPIAVVQAGGAFGFFLACGTVIRCDEKPSEGHSQLEGAARPPAPLAAAIVREPAYCAVVSAVLGPEHQ